MLIAALIIYVILALLLGPFWPLSLVSGQMGWLGYVIVGGWVALLISSAG